MVEYTNHIDIVFATLADPVRRDIVERVQQSELTMNQIAIEYDMSLAAVSKHVKLLTEAGLVNKRKQGRYQFVSFAQGSLDEVHDYLTRFEDTINDSAGE